MQVFFHHISQRLLWCIFLAFTSTLQVAYSANNNLQLTKEESSWLARQQKIRIGTMDAWPPMDFVNAKGKPQGIGAHFLEIMNQRLGNKIEIVPGAWDTIYPAVKNKKLDAIMGITPRADREAFFNFTRPYVTVPHAIFAQKDSANLNNLYDLNTRSVAVERGFFIAKVLKENYPKVKIKKFNSTSDALDALTKGDVDAYVGNRAVAMHIIETELITNIKQFGKITETSSINAIGVRKDQPILRNILQKALDNISIDERRDIFSTWAPSETDQSSVLNLSASEKQWIESHPVVRIAFDENYPPYSFKNKNGKFVGIAVDYVNELADRVGINLEIYPEGNWKKLYAAAQQRDVDVIATLVKREQRTQWFEFTRPYISLAQYIITRKELMASIAQPSQLAGKRVALIEDYSMTKLILEEVNGIKPYYVSNLSEALNAVSIGKADATIGAIGIANYLISKDGLNNLGFAVLHSKGQSEQRFGVRNDWPELASILDKALQSLSDEKIINIFERWTQPQIAMIEAELFDTNIKLTNDEWKWLKKHPVIRIASDPNWAPIEFIDENGEFKGISADYVKRLEKILKIKFEQVKDLSWLEIIESFKQGKIDLLTSLNKTPEREKFIRFTDSYTHFPIGTFSGPNIDFIGDMQALHGKRVGVVKGYAAEELLQTNYPQLQLTTANDPVDALDLLSSGQIDAYIGNILVTSYYIGKLGYAHIKVVGKTPYQYNQSMGVRKDWPIFTSILNKALKSIPESEKNSIYKQWIGVRFEHGFDYSLLWKILLGVVVILAIFSYWTRKLSVLNKQLVLAREQEEQARLTVEEANKQLQNMDKLKSMFIASMSHELRTPLNSIIGFSGLLLQGVSGELTEKQKDSVERVSRAGSHLLSLISDVIDISKIEAGRIDIFTEEFPLKEIIDEAVESIRPLSDAKNMPIEIVATEWPIITTDRKRLLQCLLNYLSNAVKYSEQGTVTLTVTVIDKTIKISVTDSGIGIAEEDKQKLFDAFERLDSHLRVKAGGTGLGLYLTKKITTELLKGSVAVESQLGKGSTFSLTIPLKMNTAVKN